MPLIWAGSAESLTPARSSSQIEFTSKTSQTEIQREPSCRDHIRRVSYRCRDSLIQGDRLLRHQRSAVLLSTAIQHLTKAT
jgi:hypothetical protein